MVYTLSPEYFTRLKFDQFSYADFGSSPRFFVGIIGFLATWWVGLFAGWFLGRTILPHVTTSDSIRIFLHSFLLIIGTASLFGIIGFTFAATGFYHHPYWGKVAQSLMISDVPAFVKVALIHTGSYLGGLIGIMIAIWNCKRQIRQMPATQPIPMRRG